MSSARFNWNVFPSTKLEASRTATPLGCMFTPFEPSEVPVSIAKPLSCSSCGTYINSHIKIDRVNCMWRCPVCLKMTSFPEKYALPEKTATDASIPAEIRPSALGSVDYVLSTDISRLGPSRNDLFVVAYVLDKYQHTEALEAREFELLKRAVARSVAELPENARVMLVTFSDVVEVFLPASGSSASFLPRRLFGEKGETASMFTASGFTDEILRATNAATRCACNSDLPVLLPPNDALQKHILALAPKLTRDYKPERATGLALAVATTLLSKTCAPYTHGKLMAFFLGPPTLFPGLVVRQNEHMRSHRQVANLEAPHFMAASKYYRALAYVAVGYRPENAYAAAFLTGKKLVDFTVDESTPKFSVDIYTGSLDQVGIYEMRALADCTGGSLLLSDSFASAQFFRALERNMNNLAAEKLLCKLTVVTSSGAKVMKAVLCGTELQSLYQLSKLQDMHHQRISDTVTQFDSSLKKRNFTNQWFLGTVSDSDTVAVYFEPETSASSLSLNPDLGALEVVIQFQTQYWDMARNCFVLRVTTVKRPTTLAILAANQAKLSNGKWRLLSTKGVILKEAKLLESFDAKAWMALFARLLISKIDTTVGFESFEEVVDEVDRLVIKLLKHFSKDKPKGETSENPFDRVLAMETISLPFRDLPAYCYSLRRNPQLIKIFNSSPDETAYNHHLFFNLDTEELCCMIRPRLFLVDSEQLTQVLLDVDSLNQRLGARFFVLDCVSHVIIFNQFTRSEDKLPLHNSNNDDLNSDDMPALKATMDLVSKTLLQSRLMVPRIVVTQSGHSQARFLFARLNPTERIEGVESATGKFSILSLFSGARQPQVIGEDVSVEQFYEELLDRVEKYAVESS